MVVQAGPHSLGAGRSRIVLRTFRIGLATRAGHDLSIEVTKWSGELTVNDDLTPAGLTASIDMGSLAVREGTGGIKPLTDKDRRDIAGNARKTLGSDRHPGATFTATSFEPSAGGGTVSGTLTLAGSTRPIRLQVSQAGADRYHVTTTVVQSEYGIKPYTGLFGALKVRDAVDVEADIDLSPAATT